MFDNYRNDTDIASSTFKHLFKVERFIFSNLGFDGVDKKHPNLSRELNSRLGWRISFG